jgi:hypothetical protein
VPAPWELAWGHDRLRSGIADFDIIGDGQIHGLAFFRGGRR